MRKYISPFIVGFGAGVIQIIPFLKGFSCCLIIPLAAILALYLDQKANSDYTNIVFKKAAIFGLLTGFWAAIFGTSFEILITLVTKSSDIITSFAEIQDMIKGFPFDETVKSEVIAMMTNVVNDIKSDGFSSFYFFALLVNNIITNVVFSFIGGIIGMQILNSRNEKKQND